MISLCFYIDKYTTIHHTLAGQDTVDDENERAVATVEQYKRVWCVHPHVSHSQGLIYKSWHIGIIPRM